MFVTAGRHDGDAIVSVRDLGPPVAERDVEKVFEPYDGNPAFEQGARGIGLGLTLSRRVIEAMNGRIEASSVRGGGLSVSFSLPLADSSPAD